METPVIVIHVLASISIIGLILLQQGKGAEMGASFGAGASQTLFGSGGSGNFFSRLTAFISVVFFATSFALAVIAKEKTTIDADFGIPSVEEQDVPAVQEPAQPESDVPAVQSQESPAAEIPAVDSEQDVPQPAPDDAPQADEQQ